MERTWQKTAVSALAVLVLGVMVPVWPDGVRFAALAVVAVLAAIAVVQRRRARAGERPEHHDGPQDAAFDPATDPNRTVLPLDQRHPGVGGQGYGGQGGF